MGLEANEPVGDDERRGYWAARSPRLISISIVLYPLGDSLVVARFGHISSHFISDQVFVVDSVLFSSSSARYERCILGQSDDQLLVKGVNGL